MSQSTPSTFRDLFDVGDFRGVEIPIIQRDYAQGRSTATDIRNQFIQSLYQALTAPSGSLSAPLDLDFIYGSLDKSDLGTVFSPLDGQQRLTALFLLHWYLAVHDGKMADFRMFMCRGRQSRFSYKIRASADDFFDTLANADFVLPKPDKKLGEDGGIITQSIQNQPWFFLAWRQDPTVASALCVLDAIHERFKDADGLYERLVDRDHPAITFQFLNLRDFGLSDELYIKMNARGKALSEYEAFKARLEQRIDGLLKGRRYPLDGRQVSPKEYFANRVDSVWADVFWHYRDGGARSFDQQFMNYVRGLVTVTFPYAMRDGNAGQVNDTIRALSDNQQHFNFYRYDTRGCLTSDFAEMLISVLDQISANGHELKPLLPTTDYYPEEDMFIRVLRRGHRGVLQAEWVQFCGYCAYLNAFRPNAGDDRFAEWMRLVSNLARNTIINRADDFIRALVGVRTLLRDIGNDPVSQYVADHQEASGLNQQQWREEHIKAQLMRRDPKWRELLLQAETHGYFRGQIEFILDYSGVLARWNQNGVCDWNDEDDANYRVAFKAQYERAAAIFGDTGLKTFDKFVWERALLSYGDYLLPNGRNLSLLDNEDREASWKRLLRGSDKDGDDGLRAKRELVRSALAIVDPADAQGSLERRIQEYLATAETSTDAWWQRMLVECPDALAYCRRRFIRNAGQDGLFLLQKERTSAYHAELRTYHLAKVVLPNMQNRGLLRGFSSIDYKEVCGEDSLPYAMLYAKKLGVTVSITFQSNRFQVIMKMSEKFPGIAFEKVCTERGFYRSEGEVNTAGRSVPVDEIGGVLEGLSECLNLLSEEKRE